MLDELSRSKQDLAPLSSRIGYYWDGFSEKSLFMSGPRLSRLVSRQLTNRPEPESKDLSLTLQKKDLPCLLAVAREMGYGQSR